MVMEIKMTKIKLTPEKLTNQSSVWDRAFEEIIRSRETNTRPNPEVFKNLTKSTCGN